MRSLDAERAFNSCRSLEQPQICIRQRPSATWKHHSRRLGLLQQASNNPSTEQTRASLCHAESISWKRTSGRPPSMHTQATSTPAETVEDLRKAEGEGTASPQALAEDAITWASQHGLVIPPHDLTSVGKLIHVPCLTSTVERISRIMPTTWDQCSSSRRPVPHADWTCHRLWALATSSGLMRWCMRRSRSCPSPSRAPASSRPTRRRRSSTPS